ncbi:MAG: DUF2127 domain-containing protein, partial [Planctomycetaceae bacterium]|nr:DUF2127 domain-containing protein [Planctomycetaceae bacterium]
CLLAGYRWAYPAALTVFGLLAGYEVVLLARHPSVLLGLIILVDLAVIALIRWHWRADQNPGSSRRRSAKAKARAAV